MFIKRQKHRRIIKLTTPITLKHFDFAVKQVFKPSLKLSEQFMDLCFTFHGINLSKMRIIINQRYIVLDEIIHVIAKHLNELTIEANLFYVKQK